MLRYNSPLHRVAYFAILFVFALLFLFGCYNSRKALADTDKAILKFPTETLTHLREQFPCIEKPIVHITDSAAYKLWQDSVRRLNLYYDSLVNSFEPEIEYDTLHITDSAKLIQCDINNRGLKKVIAAKDDLIRKLNIQINNAKPIHDTVKIYVADSSCNKIVKEQERTIAELQTKLATAKGKWDMWFWIAMGLLALHAVWIYLKIKSFKL